MTDLALRAKPGESLTLEQMRKSLPAIFAPEPHHSRSSRYVYISTAEMIDALMQQSFLPVEARVSKTRIADKQGYAKHLIKFRAKDDLNEVPTKLRRVGDTSFEVIMRNAHDGTGSYQFMAGLLKLLCLNGLVVSDGTIANVKVLHTGNRQKQINQVVEGAFTVLDQGPKVIEKVQQWQSLELSSEERQHFAEAAHTVRFGDAETPIEASQLLHPRRYQEQGKSDLWTTFNVVQENALRGGLSAIGYNERGRPRRTTTREVKGIDGDVKLNKALWVLAERMAQLKAAA